MKKTLVTILIIALTLLMVIPATAEITDPSEARVAIVINPSSNTTIQVMMSGFLQTAEELGMKTLYIDGLYKVVKGLTTLEEVMRVAKMTEE